MFFDFVISHYFRAPAPLVTHTLPTVIPLATSLPFIASDHQNVPRRRRHSSPSSLQFQQHALSSRSSRNRRPPDCRGRHHVDCSVNFFLCKERLVLFLQTPSGTDPVLRQKTIDVTWHLLCHKTVIYVLWVEKWRQDLFNINTTYKYAVCCKCEV